MTKGFDITRFKPGTIIMRLRRSQTGDCSWIGCPAELVGIERKSIQIKFLDTITLEMGDHVVTLERSKFRHGWIRLGDYKLPGLDLPNQAIIGVEEKDFHIVNFAFRRVNNRLDFENDCKMREKYTKKYMDSLK